MHAGYFPELYLGMTRAMCITVACTLLQYSQKIPQNLRVFLHEEIQNTRKKKNKWHKQRNVTISSIKKHESIFNHKVHRMNRTATLFRGITLKYTEL